MNRLFRSSRFWLALLLGAPTGLAYGQDPALPPVNLGLTGILDGAPPGVGLFGFEYAQFYHATSIRNGNGDKLASIKLNSLLLMQQVTLLSKAKFLGGNPGFSVLQPLVFFSTSGTVGTTPDGRPIRLTHNDKVFGDLTLGPALQWFDKRLFGKPYFHRAELTFTLPTGAYDPQYLVNAGSNYASFTPFYAFTYFFTPKLSTSQRHHYTYNFENSDNEMRSGQMYYGNYSLEYQLVGQLRVGAVGYYLTQLTQDEVQGREFGFNTKEKVLAVGPAVFWVTKKGLALEVKSIVETTAENRTRGVRSSLRLIYQLAGPKPGPPTP